MKLKDLIQEIINLKNTNIEKRIKNRIKEFKYLKKQDSLSLFSELCFCVLTANYNAKKAIFIQKSIGSGFFTYSKEELNKKLKELGHRFPNKRSKYILHNRTYARDLKKIINSYNNKNKLRDWIVKNIKGIGYKEASHFLRNIGYLDFAIIDFHIIDILYDHNIISKKPCSLSKQTYLDLEEKLKDLSNKVDLKQGELDLYLWYLETGKILK